MHLKLQYAHARLLHTTHRSSTSRYVTGRAVLGAHQYAGDPTTDDGADDPAGKQMRRNYVWIFFGYLFVFSKKRYTRYVTVFIKKKCQPSKVIKT